MKSCCFMSVLSVFFNKTNWLYCLHLVVLCLLCCFVFIVCCFFSPLHKKRTQQKPENKKKQKKGTTFFSVSAVVFTNSVPNFFVVGLKIVFYIETL